MQDNNKIKNIESVFVKMPMICCSCGKEIVNEQMWEITYWNYFNNKFNDPYYCCYNCMPSKKDVFSAFGINGLEIDTQDDIFNLKDFLGLLIAILRIKEYSTFDCNALCQFINIKIANNEYNRILKPFNTKNFLLLLKIHTEKGNITTTIHDGILKAHINNKINVTNLLKNRLNYFEEVLSFVEKYKMFEKLENRNKMYQEVIKKKRTKL